MKLVLGTKQPHILWILRFISPGIKGPGREIDESHPFSVEVKNDWSFASILPSHFIAWCLIKQTRERLYQLPFSV
jgi:hypothetical protein